MSQNDRDTTQRQIEYNTWMTARNTSPKSEASATMGFFFFILVTGFIGLGITGNEGWCAKTVIGWPLWGAFVCLWIRSLFD